MTKCNSGLTLNPLMHVFIFLTLAFSVAFLFFGDTTSVSASILYIETIGVTQSALNLWAIIGIATVTSHLTGLLIRGKIGDFLMRITWFGGFYMWLWAAVIYIGAGFWFQLIVAAVPNLLFWTWYAWQWRKRHNNERVAFV